MEKRRNCSLGAISPLFHNIFHLLLDFHVYAGTRFSLRDKRLFEISEVEIARVNCNMLRHFCMACMFLRSIENCILVSTVGKCFCHVMCGDP